MTTIKGEGDCIQTFRRGRDVCVCVCVCVCVYGVGVGGGGGGSGAKLIKIA